MEVFYNPNAIANIISPMEVMEKYRVTMDTGGNKDMNLHLGDDKYLKFMECHKGLYYLDTNTVNTNNSNNNNNK